MSRTFLGVLLVFTGLHAAGAAESAKAAATAAKPKPISIAMRDGLRFDPPRFEAKPGQDLVIALENRDSTDQMHNFVLLQPGSLTNVVTDALMLGDKGPAVHFVPSNPSIIVASDLLGPDKKQFLKLVTPKAPGVYPYACTFPGHGFVMYGAAYIGVPMPPLAEDKNVPPTATQSFIAGGGRRPFVQRIFMPDSGPAAIAIALPGELNACWDAGQCRLRYAWKGGFIDATKLWAGSGKDLPDLLGKVFWRAPADAFPLRMGQAGASLPQVKFLGYRLEKGFPEFHYTVDGVEVFESIQTSPADDAVVAAFRIDHPTGPVFYEGAAKEPEFRVTIAP